MISEAKKEAHSNNLKRKRNIGVGFNFSVDELGSMPSLTVLLEFAKEHTATPQPYKENVF